MHRVAMLFMREFVLAAAMLFAVMVHAPSRAAAPAAKTIKKPVPATAASVTAGAAAFKKYCSFCHGTEAKGEGPLAPKDSHPPDLTDAVWAHGSTDGEIFTVITNGAGADSKMIAFKGKMPDQDLWHIINYLRSLGPKGAAR